MRLLRLKRQDDPDHELIGRYRDHGDMDALGVLFSRYIDLIFGLCVKYLKDPVDAEDATIGIFETLSDKLIHHEVENFKSWLYVLSRNHCLQILRGRKREEEKSVEYFMQSPFTGHPNSEGETRFSANGLMDCLDGLPKKQKQCIELFYFEEKSYQDIATTIAEDKDRVRSYIQNGRRNLRNCMEKNHGEDGV